MEKAHICQVNQLAMDVVVYPLVVQSIPQSSDWTLISHLLNPIQDHRSSIAYLLNPGPVDNVPDLTKMQSNAPTEGDQQSMSPALSGVSVDTTCYLVFGNLVSELEKDWNWTGLGLIGPQKTATAVQSVVHCYFGNSRTGPDQSSNRVNILLISLILTNKC